MVKEYHPESVLEASLERFQYCLKNGRVCISFSGGKDSTVAVELAIMAAQMIGYEKPIDVVYRDEECVSPETTAFALRMASRPEIKFHWCIANQPIINIFDRSCPYIWTYDPLLEPEQWMQPPPDIAQFIPDMNIERLVTRERLDIPEGEKLFLVVGIRASESLRRKFAINTTKGYLTNEKAGITKARCIYDWEDDDIWKFIHDFQIDYNRDYDVMWRLGIPKRSLRIAPLTMNTAGLGQLSAMAKAYPKWFDKLCVRCKGVRAVVNFGKRACEPLRRQGETWEDCFNRTCVNDAPEWIKKRALMLLEKQQAVLATKTNEAMPQKGGHTFNKISWENICKIAYNGDPFCLKVNNLPYVEPAEFRPGGGSWGGKPTW